MRRYRSPQTPFPHAQFLSNGNYVTVVTNAGGGSSFCRGLAVTRSRHDVTRDPGSECVYLRDVRSGLVWSAAYHPTGQEPEEYLVTFRAEKATFRRRDDEMSTQLEIAVSTEDDVEVHRVTVVNQSTRIREIDVTSYAEIVLAPPADDLAHPAFGKLFVETEYLADSAALVCHRRPRDSRESGIWAVHVLSLEGRPQGPVEWETDRARFSVRPRHQNAPPRSTAARCRERPACRSIRSPVSASASGSSRARRCGSRSRPASPIAKQPSRSRKYHDPAAASRTFALAFTHAQSGLRHLGISNDEALLFERLASRVLFADASLRADPGRLAANELGQSGLWPHAISGDLPICRRVVATTTRGAVREVRRRRSTGA